MAAPSFAVNGLGFAKLNSTTIPVTDITYTPNMGTEPFRSGGDLSPSAVRKTGGRPAFRFSTPLDAIYSVTSSLSPFTVTALEMWSAPFTGPARVATTTCTVFKMNVSQTPIAKAYAIITGIGAVGSGPYRVVMADVLVYLCAGDGLADPVTTTTGSLPTLSASPNLHTMGPMLDDTTKLWGLNDWRIDIGCNMEPIQSDGHFYPTDYRMGAISASATILHHDISAIYTALTSDGKDASGAGVILYARAAGTNGTTTTTGYSFTFAKCFASLDSISLVGTDLATTGITLTSYAAPGTLTHPITVATGATLPVG